MSLRRSFPIWRETQLQLAVESFNVTNTPQFGNPSANISTPSTFGIITSSNSNRSLRLSGRLSF